jgi:hypothetical protein
VTDRAWNFKCLGIVCVLAIPFSGGAENPQQALCPDFNPILENGSLREKGGKVGVD